MTRQAVDPNDPPPSLEEVYACATVTSDLGLPRGDAAGPQGVLAAAAWTEVQVGSALRRMRSQWEREKPTRHIPRTREQLMAAGLTRDQARAHHKRQRLEFAQAYYRQRIAVFAGLRELAEVREQLTMHAARLGYEDADLKAMMVLHRWVENRSSPPFGADGLELWSYLDDCLANAKRALPQGMKGLTNHHPARG